MDAERQRIINEAARILNDIEQQFIDAEYWNRHHPDQEPIDPDPTGELAHWKRGFEGLLKNEARLGNHPSVLPTRARPRRYIPMPLTDETAKWILGDENRN